MAQWLALVFCAVRIAAAAATPRPFDVPAESAEYSIPKFIGQAGLSVMYDYRQLKPFKTHALRGRWEPLEALARLLKGSGLEFSVDRDGVISVYRKASAQPRSSQTRGDELPVVRIPGWRSTSSAQLPAGVSLQRVTAEDLVRAGFSTVADWARTLPYNFGGGATEDTRTVGREAPTNTAYGSGMNLFGLGSRATLILVNGRRLAPSGSAGTFTDIANLPISAIDHIELISNGAAVLYGADAMGGVVNFVLKEDPSAPESQIMGGLSAGALAERKVSQSFGQTWPDAKGVLALEYYARNALPAADRSQAANDLAGTWILPHQERLNLYGDAEWRPTTDSNLFVNVLLNRRRIEAQTPITLDGRVDTGQFTVGAHWALDSDWAIQGTLGYAFENQTDVEEGLANGSAVYHSGLATANFSSTGPVVSLPAGFLKLTLGSEYRLQMLHTSFVAFNLTTTPATDRDRTTTAWFVESAIPVLNKLDLSAGVRFEHYSDVGSALSPQIGFVFSPDPTVVLQGTWVRLLRPPNLPDLTEAPGGNPGLRPETARSGNLNMTVAPRAFPGMTAALTFFETSAANRIHEISSISPTGVLDIRLRNAETLITDGLDFAQRYQHDTPIGTVRFALDGTYVLRYAQKDAPTSPFVELRNSAHNPVALHARGTIGWERQNVWALLAANYQGHYTNTDVMPQQPVNSWTTWDLAVGYRIPSRKPHSANQIEVVLSGQNIFNQQPPFLRNSVEGIAYDEENGDLLGRRVTLALKVRW